MSKSTTSISEATKKNFEKLNKDLSSHVFSSRANKTQSTKSIIPVEYYTNKANIPALQQILNKVSKLSLDQKIDTLIVSYLIFKNLVCFERKKLHSKYKYIDDFIKGLNPDFSKLVESFPADELDPIGICYQQILTEGEKNQSGSYYTPSNIVKSLIGKKKHPDKIFLDPCCGTGAFCLEATNVFDCDKIYASDLDPIAVKVCKTNLFIKNPNVNFNNQIKVADFILAQDLPRPDFIITNPPWGSLNNPKYAKQSDVVKSKEAFSYFIEKALSLLKPKGQINFLLPISILNVNVHKDIRKLILDDKELLQIELFGKCFKGVLTDVISLNVANRKSNATTYKVITKSKEYNSNIEYIKNTKDLIISLLSLQEESILKKIKSVKHTTLIDADFALGIVTGDNKNQIKSSPSKDLRPIVVGKDLERYSFKKPTHYIKYDRSKFQQVCDDKYFSTSPKFIYKFISKYIVCAIDYDKSLILNNSNIFILPKDFKLLPKVVLALLNSNVLNFYFQKEFNQIKVLKQHLQVIPLILATKQQQNQIEQLVDKVLNSKTKENIDKLNNYICKLYGLSQEEINYINSL